MSTSAVKEHPHAGRYNPEYYKANRERIISHTKKWCEKNKTKVNVSKKNYYKNNEQYRQNKLIKMKEYRERKKAEKIALKKAQLESTPL